jgi:acyl carrier protein
MKLNQFLESLKLQFEEDDSNNITSETILSNLDTWDSLTRLSIITFLDDEHQYEFGQKDFEKYLTPNDIYNLIYSKKNVN